MYSFEDEKEKRVCHGREEVPLMGKHRPSGDGMVRLRESGRWECRMVVSHKKNGDSIFHYVSSNTQKKMLDKLHRDMDAYWSADLSEESRNPGGATAPPHLARRDTDHRQDQDLCGNPENHPACQHGRSAAPAAGLPGIRFHDLRHTFATHALASDVDGKPLSA